MPQYVAERLIDKLDKRSSDVALLKTSVSMQQQVVQAGKALRVLYSSDKGKEVDTLSQISLSLSSGSGAFDLNAFQDLDSVSEDTDTIGGHSDAVSGK